jgi:hypothetical protein
MLTSGFHWESVRLVTGDLVGTAFAGTLLKYFCFRHTSPVSVSTSACQCMPPLQAHRGVNVKLPLAQHKYQKN